MGPARHGHYVEHPEVARSHSARYHPLPLSGDEGVLAVLAKLLSLGCASRGRAGLVSCCGMGTADRAGDSDRRQGCADGHRRGTFQVWPLRCTSSPICSHHAANRRPRPQGLGQVSHRPAPEKPILRRESGSTGSASCDAGRPDTRDDRFWHDTNGYHRTTRPNTCGGVPAGDPADDHHRRSPPHWPLQLFRYREHLWNLSAS